MVRSNPDGVSYSVIFPMSRKPPETDLPSLDCYRSYLMLLAQAQMGQRIRTKLDASDIVQQTLLRAHQARGEFRGAGSTQLAAWLRQILVRTIASAHRDLHRAKRDLAL